MINVYAFGVFIYIQCAVLMSVSSCVVDDDLLCSVNSHWDKGPAASGR